MSTTDGLSQRIRALQNTYLEVARIIRTTANAQEAAGQIDAIDYGAAMSNAQRIAATANCLLASFDGSVAASLEVPLGDVADALADLKSAEARIATTAHIIDVGAHVLIAVGATASLIVAPNPAAAGAAIGAIGAAIRVI